MNPSILDKKINYDYLEKDVGLKRFFPDLVLQQKVANLKTPCQIKPDFLIIFCSKFRPRTSKR